MGSGNSKPVISPEDYSRRLASLSTGSYSQADSLHPRRQSQVDQDHVRGAEGDDHHLPRSRTSHDPNEMSSSFTPGRRERRRDRGHGEPMMDATIPSTSTSVPPHALSDRISGPPSPAKPSQPQPPADEPPQERRRSKKKKAEEPPSRHSPENLARAESTDGPPPIAETKTRRLKRDTDSVEAPSTARPSTVTTAPPSTSAEALPPPVKESELIAAAPPATRQSTPPMAPPPLPPAAPLTSSPSISASPKKVPKKKPTAETEPQRLEPRPPQVTPAAAQATQTDSEKKKSVESTATQTEKRRHHRHREQGASDSETATTTSTASAPSVPETHHKRAIATDGESYPSFGAGGGASKSQFRTPRSTPTPNRSGKPIVVKQPSVILPVIDTRSRQPEESLMKEVPRAPSRTTATSSHRSSHSSSTRYRPPSHPPLHIHKRVDGEEVPVDVTESETEGNPITDSGSSRMKQSTEADRSNDDPLHHLIYNLAMQVVNLGDGKSATPTPSESSRGAKSNDLGTKALTTSSNPTVMVHLSMDEVNALRSLCNGEELSATPRGGRPIPNSARVPKSSPRKVEEKDDVVQKEEVESNNTVSSYTTATASVFSTDPIRVYPLRRRRPGEERKKKDESKPPLHPATVHISHAPPTDVIHPTRRSTREPTPAEEEEDIEVSRRDSAMEKLREAVLSAMEDPIPDELHSSILEQPHHVAQEQAAPAPVTESRHAEPRKEPLQLHQSKASSRATPVLTAPVSVTNNGKEFVFELRLTMHADSDTPTVEWVMKRPFKPDVGERVTADSTKSEPLMMPARAPSVVPSIESSVLDTNAGEEVAPVKPVCTSRKSSLLPPRLSYTRRSMESSLLETKDVHQPISSECASPVAVALPPRGVYEVQPVDGCLRDNGESTEAPKEILPLLAAVTPSEGEPEAGIITINMSPSPSQQHGPIHVTNPLGNDMQDNENALYQQGVVLLVNDDAQDGMSPRNTERSAFHSAVDGDDLFGPSSYAIIDDVDGENVTLVLVSEVQDGIHAAGESAADNMSAHSEVSGQDGNEERDFLHGSPQQIMTDATGAISRVLSLATGMTTLLESWVLLVPHINEFGKDVYSRLLQRHPEFASLFITTDMTTQPGKLMTMIGRAVVRFSQPSLHMQLLTETGARHCMYGVDEQHAAVMARAFMAILPKYVSPKVYRRSKDVWRLFWGTAVQLLANGSRSERGNLYRRRYWEIWCGRVQKVMAVLVEKQMGNIEVDQKHHFFSKVFQRATERHPDLSSFQNRTERATDRAMDAFITMVKCLNDTTVVDNYLVELGQKHQEYGVTPDVLNKYRQPFLDVCAEYLEGNPVWDPVGQLSMAQMWDYIAKVWGQCNRASFHDETQEVKNLSAPDGNEPFCLIFTDVEASTKLWDRHPDLMSAAVQQHHRMIRSIIADYNGYEVKTVGDSFLIATKDALSALKIALAIQLDFMRGPIAKGFKMVELTQGGGDPKCWRDDSFRIRIGIHYCTDSTAVYDTVHQRYDYYGPDVNCAARVEAAASGGQILMTKATLFALHDIPEFTTAPRPRVLASTSTAPTTGEESQRPLSSYVTFIDEGSVPMKGISHPVTLIAVVHEVLAGRTFPVKASQRASQFHRKSAAEAILGIA